VKLLNTILKGTAMNYTWAFAALTDVDAIVKMAEQHFQIEIDQIFKPDPPAYARNLAYSVLNQTYYPTSELLTVAKNDAGELIAYNWAKSGDRAFWSDDCMVNVRMVHVDLALSPRLRIKLIKDMMLHWEQLAIASKNPIVCSTTMRHDQDGFLKLHIKAGYSVRGSYAYKKVSALQTGLPIP
jgi:hypothetical protein